MIRYFALSAALYACGLAVVLAFCKVAARADRDTERLMRERER